MVKKKKKKREGGWRLKNRIRKILSTEQEFKKGKKEKLLNLSFMTEVIIIFFTVSLYKFHLCVCKNPRQFMSEQSYKLRSCYKLLKQYCDI